MDKKTKNKFIYHWHEKNTFTLHVDGEKYFPRLLQLIQQARHYIIIEQYLVESGSVTNKLIDALVEAARRDVTILLLFDDFGCTGLSSSDRQRLQQKNIQLIFFNPIRYHRWYSNLKRDHRKLIIVDHHVGMIGGAGFTDEFDTANQPVGWHDVLLEASGPVINDWLSSFLNIWQQYAEIPPAISQCPVAAKTDHDMAGRFVISHPPQRNEILRSVISHIQRSKQQVWLVTPYFVITRKLRRALIRAAKRGVDVRLLLPGKNSDHPWVTQAFHNYYDKLLRQNIRIFEYQPTFIHAKMICCDNWVTIGSSNLDRWNRRWSLDANQEIKNSTFVKVITSFFDDDFSKSYEITLSEWRQRSWLKRLREKFWKQIVIILDMIGNPYRR